MTWCPRQTPSSGVAASQARTVAMLMRASAGAHGPGEMTMPNGPAAAMSCAETSSLRTTATWHPPLSSRCARDSQAAAQRGRVPACERRVLGR